MIAATGSRSALLVGAAFVLAAYILSGGHGRSARRHGWIVGAGLVILTATALAFVAVNRLDTASPLAIRQAAWSEGVRQFLGRPWLGEIGNSSATSQRNLATVMLADGRAIHATHAHNFWIEAARRFGVLGLAAATILSVAVGLVTWRRRNARLTAFVAGIFVLCCVDLALFDPSVVAVTVATVLAFPPPEITRAGMDSSAATGAG